MRTTSTWKLLFQEKLYNTLAFDTSVIQNERTSERFEISEETYNSRKATVVEKKNFWRPLWQALRNFEQDTAKMKSGAEVENKMKRKIDGVGY